MLFAYYVHHLSPYLVEFWHGIGVRWYGLSYVLGFLVGILLYKRLAARGYSDIKPDAVADFIVGSAIFGVVFGGRLGYMLFYNLDGLISNPIVFFKIWDGGMASHGGIAGVALYTLWYARRHKVSWRNLCDNIAVVAPLGLMFGRIANFINGELYGNKATVPWAVQFPREILFNGLHDNPVQRNEAIRAATAINASWDTPEAIVQAAQSSPQLRHALEAILTPRHPSQLYEAALEGAFLFCLLWILRTRFRLANGVLAGTFFIAYAGVRILGESFRENDAALTGPLTRGQFLSLFLVAIGLCFIASARVRPAWPPKWRQT
ncbi:MAG: prolipoprotein diacylglyceryl transferase [Chthoniobacterales bacterium]